MPSVVRVAPAASGRLAITFPFDRKTIEEIKSIPGTQWSPQSKAWTVGRDALPVLQKHFGRLLKVDPKLTTGRATPAVDLSRFKLWPSQEEAVRFLLARDDGAICGDAPGVGKTATCIAWGLTRQHATQGRVLVVYPRVARGTWAKELRRLGGPELVWCEGKGTRSLWRGTLGEPAVLASEDLPPNAWIGCHYEILGAWAKDLIKIAPLYLIGDELHRGMNRKAQRTQALFEIRAATVQQAIGATGTPVRSGVRNLWSMVEIVRPGAFGGRFGEPGSEFEGQYIGYWRWAGRYCNPPEAPIWMGDYTFKPLGEVRVGDEVIGWDRRYSRKSEGRIKNGHTPKQPPRNKLRRATVTAVNKRIASLVSVTFESGRVIRCTPDHLWLTMSHFEEVQYAPARLNRRLTFIADPTEPVLSIDEKIAAAYVAGVYDGEGHDNFIAQSSEKNPGVIERVAAALSKLGIAFTIRADTEASCGGIDLTGGWRGLLKFLRICRPARWQKMDRTLLTGNFRTADRIVKVEPSGQGEVVSLTTTTGNYVAWGYASKNCGEDASQPDEWGGYDDTGTSNEDELAARLKDIVIRREREQLIDLPPIVREMLEAPLKPGDLDKYEAAAAKLLPLAEASKRKDREEILNQLLELVDGMKLPMAAEIAMESMAGGEKVAILTHFHKSLETLDSIFTGEDQSDSGPPWLFVAPGWMVERDREKVYDAFQAFKGPAIFVGNTLSSGIAINQLACASRLILTTLEWCVDDLIQAEARVARAGQKSNRVLIQYLLALGTIDQAMATALFGRGQVVQALFGKSDHVQGLMRDLDHASFVDHEELKPVGTRPPEVMEATLKSMLADRKKARAMQAKEDLSLVGGAETDHLLDDEEDDDDA